MRQPRQLRDGARYHVTARANRKEMILDARASKELFLTIVMRAKKRYPFRIENFTVMGNHFHLVIVPIKEASLSRIMQWIMSRFAVAYNKIHGFTGHVWGDRFFSRIIAGLRDLLSIFEYIDENPVKAKQVVHRRDWPYGGLWHTQRGCLDLVDEAPAWMKALFPGRGVLLLGCRPNAAST